MIHFIRLTRPLNLFIIALTMYGLGWYLDGTHHTTVNWGVTSLDFFLLVISTVMIAAAGNIINDYFDVRADRVNKPERLIIGKHIKRRVAIVTHWGLNLIAFSIAVYLSWKLQTFWYVFIHLLSINILWYYSSYFKRKFIIGNVLIAGLTAMVPLLVGFYFFQRIQLSADGTYHSFIFPFEHFGDSFFVIWLSTALAGFAFLLNLAREIVKDMEDVEGDKILRASTSPIVIGSQKTKILISIILMSALTGTILVWSQLSDIPTLIFVPLGVSALLVFLSTVLLIRGSEKSSFKQVNACIKLAMVFGLLSPVYWKILIIYG